MRSGDTTGDIQRSSLLSLLLLLAAGQLYGQQNLFNIPSGDITPKKKVFFQQQININSPSQLSAKSHFVTGLGNNWEAGINVINMYFDFKSRPALVVSSPFNSKEPYPFYPLMLLTLQKKWDLGEYVYLNAGTQSGTNIYRRLEGKRFTHFSYAMIGIQDKVNHKWKFLFGPYQTNWRMVGGGNETGYQAGTEIKLNHKWLFMMDHISGNHKNSVTVAGFTYNLKETFQLCFGWQVPNPGSDEKPALVLEINAFNFH